MLSCFFDCIVSGNEMAQNAHLNKCKMLEDIEVYDNV